MRGALAGAACVLAACMCAWAGASLLAPVVRTTLGRVRGLRGAGGMRHYYGVPYARAGRYQPPRDPLKWKGIYNAINRFGWCAQHSGFFIIGTEDCLQLDVHSPDKLKSQHKLPVLVVIYGGAYFLGSKTIYDPESLINKDVIVVVPNYRVGVLGFLCIDGAANLGLKDQAAALKWIQKNISAFGGDPDNVTLLGCSSGGFSIGMHILSKVSNGLFHKAVLMSGDPFTVWSFNVEHSKSALEDARKIDPNVRTKADVYKTFANASIKVLLEATQGTVLDPRYIKYTPCVEENSTDPFFHDTPYNIIKSGNFNKVPVIIGNTEDEGLMLTNLHTNETLKEWDKNFVAWFPPTYTWCSLKEKRKILNKIKSYYFGNETMSKASKQAMSRVVDFLTDMIGASSDPFAALLLEHSGQPVYRYVFSYLGSRNFINLVNGDVGMPQAATHADDIFYLFRPLGLPLPLSDRDKVFIDRFSTMIANFMKSSDPTPQQTALLPERWAPAPCWLRLADQLTLQCSTPAAPPRGPVPALCPRLRPGYGACEPALLCPAHAKTRSRRSLNLTSRPGRV